MTFNVFTDSSGSYDSYGEDRDRWELAEGGALVARRSDMTTVYGPMGWVKVEEPVKPGAPPRNLRRPV